MGLLIFGRPWEKQYFQIEIELNMHKTLLNMPLNSYQLEILKLFSRDLEPKDLIATKRFSGYQCSAGFYFPKINFQAHL
jgi:hypothetical protein